MNTPIVLFILLLLINVEARRIIQLNAVNVRRGTIPYQAAISQEGFIYCGGSILNQFHVLTAAHCFIDSFHSQFEIQDQIRDNKIYVIVGNLLFNEEDGKKHSIRNIIIHPNYDYNKLADDITVVKLMEPITFNEYIKPIELTRKSASPGDAFVSGFGVVTETSHKIPDTLQYSKVKILPNEACATYIRRRVNSYPNMKSLICTNELEGGMCDGDSGGPLVVRENGKFVLVGIVAFSKTCGSYSFYMDVFYYLPWIMRSIVR